MTSVAGVGRQPTVGDQFRLGGGKPGTGKIFGGDEYGSVSSSLFFLFFVLSVCAGLMLTDSANRQRSLRKLGVIKGS